MRDRYLDTKLKYSLTATLGPISLLLPFFLEATTFENRVYILKIHSSCFYIKMFIHNQCLILVLVSVDLIQIHTGTIIYSSLHFSSIYTIFQIFLLIYINLLYLSAREYSTVWFYHVLPIHFTRNRDLFPIFW